MGKIAQIKQFKESVFPQDHLRATTTPASCDPTHKEAANKASSVCTFETETKTS